MTENVLTPPIPATNGTEKAALLHGAAIYDEVTALVNDRTIDIVDRRRRTAIVRRRGWLVRRALLVADVIGLVTAFLVAGWLFPGDGTELDRLNARAELFLFLATLPAWVVMSKIYGLYDRDEERTDHSTADDVVGVFHMVTVGAWVFFAGSHLTDAANPSLDRLAAFWLLAIAVIATARATARAVCRRNPVYLQNTVIVGAGDVGQLIAKKLLQHPEYGINIVGFVDDEPKERREDLEHVTLLGGIQRLPAIVRLFDVDRVIVAFSRDDHERTLDLIRSMKDLDIQVDIVPRFYEIVSPSVGIHTVEGLPLVGLPPLRLARSSRVLKRAIDLAVAVTALLILAPVFAAIAVAIKFDSPGPVFFRQLRMGCANRTFRIYKFRTMTADADARKEEFAHLNKHARDGGDPRMFKIPNDPRTTRVGRFLRRYSLDELPQLINVLEGQMSLVGPRPLILEEDQHVERWARHRLFLKPGMTGPWQVLGGADIPFDEMVKLDYLYVTTWSPFNDVKLLLRTPPAVFRLTSAY